MHLKDPKKSAKLRAIFQAWLKRLHTRIFGDPEGPIEATVLDLTGKAYGFGRLSGLEPPSALGKASLASQDAAIKKALSNLGAVEKAALEAAKAHAGAYLSKLGATVEADVTSTLAQADKEVRTEVQKGTAENIATQESLGKLASKLGEGKEGWKRDWRRVAVTEKHAAMEQGAADVISEKQGPEAYVYKLTAPGACPRCLALYRDADGEPRIFKLSTLVANGTNIGRKAADWLPVVGPMHPWCQCTLHTIPAGWILSGGVPYPSKEAAAKHKALKKSDEHQAFVFEADHAKYIAQPKISPKLETLEVTPRLMITSPLVADYETVTESSTKDPSPAISKKKRWTAVSGMDIEGAELRTRLMVQPLVLRKTWLEAHDALDQDELVKSGPGGSPSASHKYTKRQWAIDHWIYEYAIKHGGRVEDHHADPDKVVVKVLDAQKLHALKANHGLAGSVGQGGKYAMLEVHKDELATKMPATAKPKVAKTPAFVVQPVKTKLDTAVPKGVQSAHESTKKPTALPVRQGDFTILKSQDLALPKKAGTTTTGAPILQRGELVSTPLGEGKVLGFDHKGRAQLEIANQQRTLKWHEGVKASGTKLPYQPAHKELPAGAIVKASDRQKKLVARALELPVVGHHKAKEFTSWLGARGYEVYVVGGVPRDMVAGTVPGSTLSDDEVFSKMKDVDIVTTAPTAVVEQMLHEVAHDVPGMSGVPGVRYRAGELSITLAGGPKVSKLNVEGLDISTMVAERPGKRSFFVPKYQSGPKNADTGEESWGLVFDHSLQGDTVRRDFASNALYYDPLNDAIIDPTGNGIADAQAKHLRLAGTDFENANNTTLAARFWKFRIRGYQSDAETKKKVHALSAKFFAGDFQGDLVKQAGKHVADPSGWLANLKKVMVEDGAGDLYAKHVQPKETAILAALKAKS